jgi:hypothetical protein
MTRSPIARELFSAALAATLATGCASAASTFAPDDASAGAYDGATSMGDASTGMSDGATGDGDAASVSDASTGGDASTGIGDGGGNDASSCVDACVAKTTQCSGAKVETCTAQANGCSDWSAPAKCAVGSCLVDACTAVPVDSALVAYYSFEEPGPGVVDRSGNGNDGKAWNATQVTGKIGMGYQTGSQMCLLFPLTKSAGDVGGGAITHMAWAKPSTSSCAAGDNEVIYNKDFAYEIGLQCGTYKAQTALATTSQSWVWDVSTPVALDAWHHFATTWDGATLLLYVDGAQAGTWAATGQFYQTTSGEGIGCYHVPQDGTSSNDISGFFTGVVDEVAVYNRALTAQEIASYYAATK